MSVDASNTPVTTSFVQRSPSTVKLYNQAWELLLEAS